MLAFTPRQSGVDCTMLTPDQQKSCKVTLVKGRGGSGWLLSDAGGQPVRRFYDSNGDNKIDLWSYYRDGVEIYREVDSNFNGKADQYRWLNTGGSKWGVDVNEDGRIDSWKVISAAEASQEMLQALATGDYGRLQVLLLTEAEIKALEVGSGEAKRLRDALKQAQAHFNEQSARFKGAEKVTWMHLETALPQCRPADTIGSRFDLIRQQRGTVIYDMAGKNDWVYTGEMVKVGEAWRLVDGPSQSASTVEQPGGATGGATPNGNPKIQKKMEELSDLDKNPPQVIGRGPNEAIVRYNLKRADLLEEIAAEAQGKERENWIHQLVDCLATAMQNSAPTERAASDRLDRIEKQLVESAPGSSLAGFVVYRHIQADTSRRLLEPKADYAKVQQEAIDRLAKFVAAYPRVDDTPEALLQLGMTCEFLAKEPEAKKWYAQLARDFPEKTPGVKARGALKRLDLEGKELTLSGATTEGSTHDIARQRGKVVAVYYWASWNQQTGPDFIRLKQMMEAYGSKGFEVVCVNLDNTPEEAATFLKTTPAPSVNLTQSGGLESTLAMDYGIMVLPNLFLVGKDGKVVSRTLQVAGLEDELKKVLSK
jgi:hypothetical protein